MTVTWTPEQILGFAPDETSRKNAVRLAERRQWLRQFQAEVRGHTILWGEYQGSGAAPYRCQADLSTPHFQCTCPSHKTPCKHVLGLLLLFSSEPQYFEVGSPPDWVSAWLRQPAEPGRQASSRSKRPVDLPNATVKNRRSSNRDQKIRAGLDELETWLCDLLRQGLASAQAQPRAFWESAAARMVDAQAPGLARIIRTLPDVCASGEGWQETLLDQIARMYLMIQGYRRIDELSAENQADLRSLVGIARKQEELADLPGVQDTWLVMGRSIEEESGLFTQRVWLCGQSSGKAALILSFAPPGGRLDGSLIPGMAIPGELVFYPSAYPLRALFRSRETAQSFPESILGCASLVEATAGYAAALTALPWLERYPMLLSGLMPVQQGHEWFFYDADRRRIPIAKNFLQSWTLLSLSGGRPIGIFGEWNGEQLYPLSAWTEDHRVAFQPGFD